MLADNTYHGMDEAAWSHLAETVMDARLLEQDRRAIDFLLSGDPADKQDVGMPRVSAAQRILSVLGALPAGDPPATMVEATLRKAAASQLAGSPNPPSASANV